MMTNDRGIKPGDRVRQTKHCSGTIEGEIYVVEYLTGELRIRTERHKKNKDVYGGCTCDCDWELVEETIVNDWEAELK